MREMFVALVFFFFFFFFKENILDDFKKEDKRVSYISNVFN